MVPQPSAQSSSTSVTPQISLTRSRSRSPSVSSNERYFEAEDGDRQTKRRSMLRSVGTASSPDLATLVRKAKQRSAAGQDQGETRNKEQRTTGARHGHVTSSVLNSLSPNSHRDSTSSRTRKRSSTTVNNNNDGPSSMPFSHTHKGKLIKSTRPPEPAPEMDEPISSDWVMTGSRNRSETVVSKGKSSVRSKTSAFLGKIIGQSSIRDKSRNDSVSSPTTPIAASFSSSSFYDDAPPVPPIPREHRSPIGSPIADAFSSPPNSPDVGKPLPLIQSATQNATRVTDTDDDDERSMILVDRGVSALRTSSPERTIKGKSPRAALRAKRRSMSVSEADLKKAMASGASERGQSSLSREWESGSEYSGMLKDFKGELTSQLDGISASSLDLKDPATPRKETFDPESALADARGRLQQRAQRPQLRMVSSTPVTSTTCTPALTLDTAFTVEDALVPAQSARTNTVKPGLRNPRPNSTSAFGPIHSATLGRDSSRLRVQHRSAASSSEPSLIPIRDDDRSQDPKRTVRLVPSSASVGWPEATSPALSLCLSSQTDLTCEETGNSKMTSSAASREDPPDIETRGKDLATKCWTEDEDFLAKEKIAEWLGGTGLINKVALRYYIDFFDFSGLRLDVAFRRLCAKLYLKAETQQVDRILEEFSRRYWETNPTTVYGSASVVHAVSYSLLLLNTDLHVAELAQRMSRSQFVRNTLSAIQMQIRPSGGGRASTPELTYDDESSIRGVGSDGSEVGASTLRNRAQRSGSVTSWNSVSRDFVNTPATTPNSGTSQTQLNGSNTSIHEPRIKTPSVPSVIYGRHFDSDMESLLKEMYTAIKTQQILQPINHSSIERGSTSSLSPNALLRNGSRRGQNDRVANLKRGSMRGIQSLFAAHAGASPYGNSGSFDGRASPAPSFANSAHEVGMNNYAASSSQFLPPTLGFASNLSHTIIREAQEDDVRSIASEHTDDTNVSISDEELALLGAPWAKEGMLCRKQYWESAGKRAKSKNWLDVFVVIQKGELNMFIFGGEGGGGATMGVGGGNWLANAHAVGTVSLSHSLAHTLPSPGYSRQRPYCFVLTLATGGVYFFQAGTEELVNEWVSTCNYWAARLSKEPLAGGVSNMEYGWNRVMDITEDRPSISEELQPKDSDTFSMRSGRSWNRKDPFTLRSSSSPFSERVTIHDWKLPMPSTVPSMHDEEGQLEALQKHAASLKAELNQHNAFRAPMQQLYLPRSANSNKALANWEKKSQYLLTEIVKYDSYVDSLKTAMSLRLKRRGEKALERALVLTGPEEENEASSKRWKGYPEEETILEGEEPPLTPNLVNKGSHSSSQHHRESAEA
ncbi:hypothetical protein DFH11DRAFT_1501723 [Phellopilus nigrolimitatus]|nr:hypothetical protein DFH11DRAFT_1501723 [Phellopilus nigrolimitatus]